MKIRTVKLGDPIKVNFRLQYINALNKCVDHDLTGAQVKMYWVKPDGVTTSSVDCTIDIPKEGKCYGLCAAAQNTQLGEWTFRPSVLFSGESEWIEGKSVKILVQEINA